MNSRQLRKALSSLLRGAALERYRISPQCAGGTVFATGVVRNRPGRRPRVDYRQLRAWIRGESLQIVHLLGFARRYLGAVIVTRVSPYRGGK